MHSDIDNLVFDTLEEANLVINNIDKVMEAYGSVSVADVYDICGLTGTYKNNGYGWVDSITVTLSKKDDDYSIQINSPTKLK